MPYLGRMSILNSVKNFDYQNKAYFIYRENFDFIKFGPGLFPLQPELIWSKASFLFKQSKEITVVVVSGKAENFF